MIHLFLHQIFRVIVKRQPFVRCEAYNDAAYKEVTRISYERIKQKQKNTINSIRRE
jgi:hypothetical protein